MQSSVGWSTECDAALHRALEEVSDELDKLEHGWSERNLAVTRFARLRSKTRAGARLQPCELPIDFSRLLLLREPIRSCHPHHSVSPHSQLQCLQFYILGLRTRRRYSVQLSQCLSLLLRCLTFSHVPCQHDSSRMVRCLRSIRASAVKITPLQASKTQDKRQIWIYRHTIRSPNHHPDSALYLNLRGGLEVC